MFIPVDIPSKYFPLILYALFCLFSGLILSFALALVVGYLYSQGYIDKLKPSTYYLENLEAPGSMLHILSRSKGWILAGAAIGNDAWIAQNSAQAGGGAGSQGSGSGSGGQGGAPEEKKKDPVRLAVP